MSQKYIKSQNKNSHNAKSFGKYYAKPVYDEKNGKIFQKYVNAKSLLKDVAFEEAHGQAVAANSPSQGGGGMSGPDTTNPDDGE